MRSYVFALWVFMLSACADGELDLPRPEVGDDHLIWVWVGQPKAVPPCPHGGPFLWEGWAEGVNITRDCGECTCGPAACVLPQRVTTSATICPGEGASNTVEIGPGFNGICVNPSPDISDDAFASVTYEPPTLNPCTPPQQREQPPELIGDYAKACMPDGDLPDGFRACIDPEADGSCDPGFQKKRKFIEGTDTRTCTPCECVASAQECIAQITLYSDGDCTVQINSTTIANTSQPACQAVPLGPLATTRTEWILNNPGTCTPKAPISVAVGELKWNATHELCCTN